MKTAPFFPFMKGSVIMPNWACGSVSITGTKQNVVKFINRFIHDDDNDTTLKSRRFFARSFTNDTKKSVLEDVEEAFHDLPLGSKNVFSLPISFAWSAESCLIDGYPQDHPDDCSTLSAACIEDQVSVEIQTEEGGMGFEESIACDTEGVITSECTDLVPFICKVCGTECGFASFNSPVDQVCYECGDTGYESVE